MCVTHQTLSEWLGGMDVGDWWQNDIYVIARTRFDLMQLATMTGLGSENSAIHTETLECGGQG